MKLSMGFHSYPGQLRTRFRGTVVDIFLFGLTNLKRAIYQVMRCKNKNVAYITYLLAIVAVIKPYATNMTFWLQKYSVSQTPDFKTRADLQQLQRFIFILQTRPMIC